VVRFQRQPGRARQDQQLAAHVFATGIDARIALGIAGRTRFTWRSLVAR